MKARVKSTGVLVDVIPKTNTNALHSGDNIYVCDNMVFRECELDFLNLGNSAIDWEQRRYELAKDIIKVVIANDYGVNSEVVAKYSLNCADAMTHHIRIINVKIERLQDIDDEDCFKEGIYASNSHEIGYGIPWVYEYKKSKMAYYTPREAFADLIDKVSGKGTWESNPYVFVYEFKLID